MIESATLWRIKDFSKLPHCPRMHLERMEKEGRLVVIQDRNDSTSVLFATWTKKDDELVESLSKIRT